jgi:hypothetical protein
METIFAIIGNRYVGLGTTVVQAKSGQSLMNDAIIEQDPV